MTDDLPTPCRPVHHFVRSQSGSFPSLVGLHLSILFSVVLSSFSLVYPFKTLSSVCVLHLSSSHALTSSKFFQWSSWKPAQSSLSLLSVHSRSFLCLLPISPTLSHSHCDLRFHTTFLFCTRPEAFEMSNSFQLFSYYLHGLSVSLFIMFESEIHKLSFQPANPQSSFSSREFFHVSRSTQ